MADKPSQLARAHALDAALKAAERIDREGFLRALEGITLRTARSAPLQEHWLAAEVAHFRGEYPKVVELYEGLERDPRSAKLPGWQLYRSSHRRAFAYLHQGDDDRALPVLNQAEERVQALPDRAFRLPDLEALYGHLYNHQGNPEMARARFVMAYHADVALENWPRAASHATDAATALLQLGSLSEALDWLDRAEDALRKSPRSLPLATLAVRRAHVFRTMEKFAEAEQLYTTVIEGPERHPDPVEAAYRGRGETHLARGRYEEAEADFQAAAELCLSHGVRHHAAYAYRGLADVCLARSAPGDVERATEHFKRAMRLVLTLQPPHPGMLMAFSEALLERPQLLGGKLPEVFAAQLRERLARLRELTRPQPMHTASMIFERREAERRLRSTFTHLDLSLLHLHKHTVNLLTGKVIPAGQRGKLTPKELEVLHLLVAEPAGVTIGQIEQKLDITLVAASGRTMRLKKALGADLGMVRERNVRRYYLRTAGSIGAPSADPVSPRPQTR